MQKHCRWLFTYAVCALAAGPAFAQATSGTANPPTSPSTQQRPEGKMSPASPSTSDTQQRDSSTQRDTSPKQDVSGSTQRDSSTRGTDQSRDAAQPSPRDKSGQLSDQRSSGSSSGDMSRQNRMTSSSQVRRVQQALKAQGHDPGPIDGVMGPRTQEALRSFQTSQSLDATGDMNQETMDKLGLGRTSSRQ